MVGETVAEYRIDAVIGRGGMGTVYRATDTGLDKTVALKMLAPRLAAAPDFLARFRAEARALARLDDPGIVRVHALRESIKGVFIVMEHVEGEPLSAYLRRRGALPPAEAAALFLPVLHAVSHAHEAGVLHRDLKPSNLIVPAGFSAQAPGGPSVKITDFGLAKIRAADTHLTGTHETAGTTGYTAPEQIEGLREADERSDLFAIGMVLYEALAQRLPFDRNQTTFAVQRDVVEASFPPPSDFADVPEGLVAVVMKALAKEPGERHQSAAEMAEALRPFAEDPGTGSLTLPTSLISDASPRRRTSRAGSSDGRSVRSVVLACLLGFLLLGSALYAARSFLPAPTRPSETQTAYDTSSALAPTVPRPSEARLSVRSDPAGAAIFLDGDSAGVTPLAGAPVTPGSLRVRLHREGFADLDTTLLAAAGDASFSLRLPPASEESPAPSGQPSRAPEDENPAATPRQRVRPDAPSRRDASASEGTSSGGASGQSASDAAASDRRSAKEDREGAEPRQETEAQPAVLKVRVAPWGTLAIDGRVVSRRSAVFHTATLDPGRYTLRATHPALGQRTVEVTLPAGYRGKRVINLRASDEQ